MQQHGRFLLFTRDEFKDWLMKTNFTRTISIIQEHHTYEPSYNDFNGNNHFQLLDGMEYYHINNAGCEMIAQNITIFPDGLIAVCRPFNKQPAGCKGCNGIGLCIENIGNFDGVDNITEEHKESIIFVTAILCIKFNLIPNTTSITYHHWWNLTKGYRYTDAQINSGNIFDIKTCPGTTFFGGNKVIDALNNFIPLIKEEINNINNGEVLTMEDVRKALGIKDASWAKNQVDILKNNGLIVADHDPNEILTFGVLATIMNNFYNIVTDKISELKSEK